MMGKSDFVIIDLDPDHSKGTHKEPNHNFRLHAKVGPLYFVHSTLK